jgi:hypothetical protein
MKRYIKHKQVWIITSADLEASDVVVKLKTEFGAKVHGGSNDQVSMPYSYRQRDHACTSTSYKTVC